MPASLTTALRTLTILPVPGRDTGSPVRSLVWFPMVGIALGVVPVALAWSMQWFLRGAPFALGVVGVSLVTLTTGALHVDGLGDVADAFGGGRSRERILAILKDPRMGSFGVTAIVLVLLLKASLWGHALAGSRPLVPVLSLAYARSAQSIVLAFLPNARASGTAAAFGGAPKWIRAGVIAGFLGLSAIASSLTGPRVAAAAGVATLSLCVGLGAVCVKRIGGITGDCVGATSELVEVAVLAAGVSFM